MFLIPLPRTIVLFLIRISHLALSILASFSELALVNFTIVPHFSALSFHIRIFKVAGVGLLKISEKVNSVTFKDAIHELALVVAAISPCIRTFTVFFALLEVANILGLVGLPDFGASPMLAVINPVAFVRVTL